jgi:hypothetical protein
MDTVLPPNGQAELPPMVSKHRTKPARKYKKGHIWNSGKRGLANSIDSAVKLAEEAFEQSAESID